MGIRRGSLLVVVALVLAAVYLLYEPPLPGRSQTAGPIDLTGEVDASQCAPCHLRIADALKAGLIFTHGNHLMVSCGACHYAMPHQGGKTNSPPMAACFDCHGVAHGPQGQLAVSTCSACHTKAFNLRPADHTKTWKGKPHAVASRKGVNSCMMCHDAKKDCDVCHTKENVRKADGTPIGPMPVTYVPTMPVKVSKPSVMIYPDRPTAIGQCIYCHPDLDRFAKGSVIFAHADHLKRDYACTVCHPTFGHGAETIERPPMETCYQCHGLTHAANGLIATEDCSKCHPKSFKLEPSNHTKSFIAGDHKTRASSDTAYCTMCHQAAFCVKCHQGRLLLASGSHSTQVLPASHKKAAWTAQHGALYLQQRGACGACHDSASCSRCHYSAMPHPSNWQANHSKVAKAIPAAQRDCNVCHTDRESCQACHHNKVKDAKLVSTACVRCHPEMKQLPVTAIKNKGFAEHAAHFFDETQVGKRNPQSPLTCNDCHVGFGTGSNIDQAGGIISGAGHDTRLCYSCHGHLDYQNVQIAPWPGAQLCLKCHTDLNL